MSDLENNYDDDYYETESSYVESEDEDEIVSEEEDDDEVIQIIDTDKTHLTIKIVPEEEKITSEVISFPEMTEAIGIRASAIENGSKIFVDYGGLDNPIDIANKEFFERKNPLILRRSVYKNEKLNEEIVEEWKIREMTFPIGDREIKSILLNK